MIKRPEESCPFNVNETCTCPLRDEVLDSNQTVMKIGMDLIKTLEGWGIATKDLREQLEHHFENIDPADQLELAIAAEEQFKERAVWCPYWSSSRQKILLD